jgi:hypothetical protein
MGLKTSQLDPLGEAILHKGYVLSDPYLTQGTCRITPAGNLCGIYVKQPSNHDITDAQENSRKLGPPYG